MATLKEALEYAKMNPNSSFATALRTKIENGEADAQAQAEGIQLPGRQQSPGFLDKVGDKINSINTQYQIKTGENNAEVLRGNVSPVVGGLQNFGEAAKAGTETILSPLTTSIDMLMQQPMVADFIKSQQQKGLDYINEQKQKDPNWDFKTDPAINPWGYKKELDLKRRGVQNPEPTYQEVQQKYNTLPPNVKGTLDAAGNVLNAGATIAGTIEGVGALKNIAGTGAKTLNEGLQVLGNTSKANAKAITDGLTAGLKGDELASGIMTRQLKLNPVTGNKAFSDISGGMLPGDYLVQKGIFGTNEEIVNSLAKDWADSYSLKKNELSKLTNEYTYIPANEALKELAAFENKAGVPGTSGKFTKKINELVNKAQTRGLTVNEIDDIKHMYENTVALGYDLEKNGVGIERSTRIDSALRKFVEDKATEQGLTNVAELNKNTQLSRFLGKAIEDKIAGRASNNFLSLTDTIIGAGAVVDPSALAVLAGKKLISSERVQSAIAKKLAKTVPQNIKAEVTQSTPALLNSKAATKPDFLVAPAGSKAGQFESTSKKIATSGQNISPGTTQEQIVKSGKSLTDGIPQTPNKASGKLISDESYKQTLKEFKKNLGNMNSGLDPAQALRASKLALYHVQEGAITLADFTERMVKDGIKIAKSEMEKLFAKARFSQMNDDEFIIFQNYINNPSETTKAKALTMASEMGFSDNTLVSNNFKKMVKDGMSEKAARMDRIAPALKAKEGISTIPKELQPLAEEARKYPTAEEFVNAQGEISASQIKKEMGEYLGYNKNDTFIKKELPLSKIKNKNTLEDFGGAETQDGSEIVELMQSIRKNGFTSRVVVDKTGKVLDGNHRIVAMRELGRNNIPVYIKTKSQLIDIWNKANGKN